LLSANPCTDTFHKLLSGELTPSQAMQLASILQRAGRTYELVIAADAKHMLQPFQAERDERAVRWFRRYLNQ